MRKGVLYRPRLEARIASILEHPVTIVHAATGYGKSTSLASLAAKDTALFWYTVTEPDRDPLLFLVHLFSAFGDHGATALDVLETNNGLITPAALNPLLNSLTRGLKEDAILVLDDFHLVSHVDEIIELVEKLVDYCPPRLHLVLSTRHMPEFPEIHRWQVKDMLSIIDMGDLAFTVDEIETLFREKYHYPLTPVQAKALEAETEGWAMALQMVWQGLQTGIVPDIETALEKLPLTLDRLFDYLAPEVLARQPAYLQRFLLTTAVLRQLDGPVCDMLLDTHDSSSTLHYLHEIGLFVDLVGEQTYRYQRLFHDFLLNQAGKQPKELSALHRRAAAYFKKAGHPEEALYHLLEAHQYTQAAALIEKIGRDLLNAGRLDSLSDWLGQLPDQIRSSHPYLEMLYGDVCRLGADFEKAMSHYTAAVQLFQQKRDPLGHSRALRGQAQIYLDTVRPLEAAALLADAFDLLDPVAHRQESAELLEQLAENKLNFGFPDQAAKLHQESLGLRSKAKATDIYLEARILLRSGKLLQAQRLLESDLVNELALDQIRPIHFHREKQLLLSLLHILQGNQKEAESYARQGISVGQKMQSEFVEAVAYMRLGHAIQLDGHSPWGDPQRQAAIRCYLDVIERVRPFKVPRVNVEPLWGLCRACGYAGELEAAENYAQSAIEIARAAGDEWFGHYVRVSLGAIHAMAGRYAAASRELTEAAEGLDRVQDTFGWSAAQLWLALNARWKGELEIALRHLSALLPVVRMNGYDFLLSRRTHLGLRDDQAAIPLLLEARRQNIEREYLDRLFSQTGIPNVEYHPGYTLWVRTLAPFQVWRGASLVTSREWQREKARQLFQLLINTRGQWLSREKIVDLLWPDLSAESAASDFKVALNAVQRALEPKRPRSARPYFINRQGNTYMINPQARLVTDADVFLAYTASDDPDQIQAGLKLYEEDYLPDCCYADWADIERENFRQKYLSAAARLAHMHLGSQHWEEALSVCQSALKHDKCWEPAYMMMMQAHASRENIPQAQAIYQRCVAVLNDELGVEPSAEIQRLHQLITQGY